MVIVALLLISIVNINLQNKAPAGAGAPAVEGIAKPDRHIIIKAPIKLEVEGPGGIIMDPWATTAYHLFAQFDPVVSCSSTYPCYFECVLPGTTNAGITIGADGVTLWCVFQPSTSSGSSTAVRFSGYGGSRDITQISWSNLDTSAIYAYRLSAPLWYNYTDSNQAIEVRQHVLPPFTSFSSVSRMSQTVSTNPSAWSITVFDSLGNQVTSGWSGSVTVTVVNQTHLRIRLSISFSSTFTLQRIVVTRSWSNMWSQPYLAMDVRFLSPIQVFNGYVMVIDKFVVLQTTVS